MKKKNKIIVISIFFGIIAFAPWVYWGNNTIQTTTYTISSPKIGRDLLGFTIVQISDLHNKEFGDNHRDLTSKLIDIKPNIIVITGDLIDSRNTNTKIAIEFIREAVKIAPVYYVTGNHESRIREYNQFNQKLKNSGVYIMDGKVEEVYYKGQYINLLGVADPTFNEASIYLGNEEAVAEEIKKLYYDKGTYTMLLSHRPELFKTYVSAKVDLVFAGHAHGGQFRIPFIGGLVAPHQGLFPKYTSGIFEDKSTKMIVSRGLGNSIIPIRINNSPELVVVKLKNTKN